MARLVLVLLLFNAISCRSQSCTSFVGWADYYANWNQSYNSYAEEMYPFGTTYCDNNATTSQKSTGINTNANVTIPFYGSHYRTIMIASHGYVTLNESANSQAAPFDYVNIIWPNPSFTPSNGAIDPPFISPFYADIDYRLTSANDPSQISWRVLDPNVAATMGSSAQSITQGMLGLLSADVRAAMVGAHNFVGTWGLIVTWYNVTFTGAVNCQTGPGFDTCQRNTFQMALVTDGRHSFTVFNYFNISWIGGAYQQQCDPTTGTKSTAFPNCVAAQVGFNAGYGRGFKSLPFSGTIDVALLDELGGTNVTGRWMYDVSHEIIKHGGCLKHPSFTDHNHFVPPPEFYPSYNASITNTTFNASTTTTTTPSTNMSSSNMPTSSTTQFNAFFANNYQSNTTNIPNFANMTTPLGSSSSPYVFYREGNWSGQSNWSTGGGHRWPHHISNRNFSEHNFTIRWPLVVYPTFGPMFGGRVVHVSGPCFHEKQEIICRFGKSDSRGEFWGNTMQVMCVQPTVKEVGPIELSVSTNGGRSFQFHTIYTILPMDHADGLVVSVVNPDNNWLTPTNPITLNWNATHIQSMIQGNNLVTISLMGYHEDRWTQLYSLALDTANLGTYSFTPTAGMCSTQNDAAQCVRYTLGAFRVSDSDWHWERNNPRALWSALVPLAWFTSAELTKQQGADWAHEHCTEWHKVESTVKSNEYWIHHLSHCPCTLNQTYVEFGRFQPQSDCNLHNSAKPGACATHQGAVACYQSTHVTMMGAGFSCCYDVNGGLMHSGDTRNGSRSERQSPLGRRSPFSVPMVSYWQRDLIPFYQCCEWQSDAHDCYQQYLDKRPTRGCKHYQPSGHASVFGDPHFVTFDGTAYDFGGWGEFWLVNAAATHNMSWTGGKEGNYNPTSNTNTGSPVGNPQMNSPRTTTFMLQARFEQPRNKSGVVIQGTVLKAIAMRLNNGPIISVKTHEHAHHQQRMAIFVNKTLLQFHDPEMRWYQERDILILNHDMMHSKHRTNFTIILQEAGIGINVAWKAGALRLLMTMPPEFQSNIGGLLGTWNSNPADDLTPRGSGSAPATPTQAAAVFSFGQSWMVQPTETLFTYLYRSAMNYAYYNNYAWFQPYLNLPQQKNVSNAQVTSLCGTDASCAYDYMLTGNTTFAAETLTMSQWSTQLQSLAAPVPVCDWLHIPYAIRQQPVDYAVGSTITITGCRVGYIASGTQMTYTCQSIGAAGGANTSSSSSSSSTYEWTPAIGFSCTYSEKGVSGAMLAAIIIPIVVGSLLILIIIIAICCCCYRRKKEANATEKKKPIPNNSAAAAGPPYTAVQMVDMAAGRGTSARSPLIVGRAETPTPPPEQQQLSSVVRGGTPDYMLNTSQHNTSLPQGSVSLSLHSGAGQPDLGVLPAYAAPMARATPPPSGVSNGNRASIPRPPSYEPPSSSRNQNSAV